MAFSTDSISTAQPQPSGSYEDGVRVEVFTTRTCEACQRLERFLTEMEVPFIRYDLDRDPAARRDYYDNIGRGKIPATRINRRLVIRGEEPAKVYKAFMQAKAQEPDAPPPKHDGVFGLTPPMEEQRLTGQSVVTPKEEFALP